eukprot:753095-Pleurochrysis_carterae.AAC.1
MAADGNLQDLDVQAALHMRRAIVQVCLRDAHLVMRNPQDTASSSAGDNVTLAEMLAFSFSGNAYLLSK